MNSGEVETQRHYYYMSGNMARKEMEKTGGNHPMKAIVFPRDKVIKILYNNDTKLSQLKDALMTVPGMELQDRKFTG